ncbi:HlyD family efflux transporter periplasmic adaptor subunit [Phaeodactylibacter sp.]|uniref:efflux RND transporter periplasmic adaptor subunit n=1 Tax=Phaeodactylibacter sp. TaxID=1940289 RepID=UPI0025E9FF7F|nr:HlyD family efflux transporter periplasmic adaptor subunit [Phaeodactylibacter sp.]MCI4649937.1 HlyD family efflux transporter periplasmic adaptor subunit [Phaeodactylibacter sp.]MCI5090167.1 HlyD family efflux transporter periplasmic adaptor subunit [Phaeodactylibacter sp.]
MNRGCLIGFGAFLIIATIGLGIYFYQRNTKEPENYEVVQPEKTDIIKKTVATGAIRPRKEVMVKPQVSGVVDEIYVEEGELVTKGQKLARIKLVPSEVNINTAKSNVELARLRLQEAQRELARQRNLNKQQLDVEEARAGFENAKQEEARQRGLFEEGVISEQDYNRFKLDLELARAAFENAKVVAQNSVKQFETEVDIREQELQAAINNLQLLREGASSNSRQVANIVTSTLDGMVLDIPVEEGTSVIERNNFNEGTSIAIVADMNALIFEGKVDESDVGKLKEGMPLLLTVGAIDNQSFDATLEFISPKGEDEEGTVKFEVRAAVKPTDDVFLRAGYSANADIILDRRKQVLAIQERDILYESDTTYVEVKTGDRSFEKRQVELGLSDGIKVEVLGGLDDSSEVKVQTKG